jgi:DNA repair ATPase RecN
MKRFGRLIPGFAFGFGLLGVIACVAAAAIALFVGLRLSQAKEKVFDSIDQSLAAVRDRVVNTRQRVEESRISTEELGARVGSWTRKEATERLTSRFEIEEQADRLASGLRQADLWLEMSEASVQSVRRAFEVARSLGAPADAASVDPLLERLGTLRNQLQQSAETVDGIVERTAKAPEDETSDERLNQVAELARRAVETLGKMDSRLEESADRLADLQTRGQELKSKTHAYIVAAEVCVVLLIAWMAAGQVSLCRRGWKDGWQSRTAD